VPGAAVIAQFEPKFLEQVFETFASQRHIEVDR
jgi:hypothetical protein